MTASAVTTHDMWLAATKERDLLAGTVHGLKSELAASTVRRTDAEQIARNALAAGSQLRAELDAAHADVDALKAEVAGLRGLLVAAGHVIGDAAPSRSGYVVVSLAAHDALTAAVEIVLGAKAATL